MLVDRAFLVALNPLCAVQAQAPWAYTLTFMHTLNIFVHTHTYTQTQVRPEHSKRMNA